MKFSLQLALCSIALFTSTAQAVITTTGDVAPADPSTWTTNTNSYVGFASDGSLTVDDGSTILSDDSYLGYELGATGTASISGAGSVWDIDFYLHVGEEGNGYLNVTNGGTISCRGSNIGVNENSASMVMVAGVGSSWNVDYTLHLGYQGDGELHITDGGAVSVGGYTKVAVEPGSSGSIFFDNGTFTTDTLWVSSSQLTGTGTINTHGLIADGIDVVFDAAHGLQQTLILNDASKNITLNLDCSSKVSSLGAGYYGSGSFTIRDGVNIESDYSEIGYKPGSTGTVTVSGAGSSWINNLYVCVGNQGSGELTITDGGVVSSSRTNYIAKEIGSTGLVTISGTSSTWTNNGGLYVGDEGDGELIIMNGGTASIPICYLGQKSGATGTVTVSGAGSTFNSDSRLDVGVEGIGQLNITDGAAVNVSQDTSVGSSGGTGTIHFDSGTLTRTCNSLKP